MRGRPTDPEARTVHYDEAGLRLHLFKPSVRLAPYITVFYRTEVPGEHVVEDFLPPESVNLRVGRGGTFEAGIGDEPLRKVPLVILNGATSRATRLRIGGAYDSWGVGLLPLGFAQFFGLPASDFVDRFVNLEELPQFADLHDLMASLMDRPDDTEANVARLEEAFSALLSRPVDGAEQLVATHRALLCDEGPGVAAMAAKVGVSPRTLERYCKRWFGFSPQLLLRRQRFLRSLAKFMVDPSMRWIASLDSHYHDQAHFVRDFRRFLGMKPSEYAMMDHPIAMTAARARRDALGQAMQILHTPPRAEAG